MCVIRSIGTSDLSLMFVIDQSCFHDQGRGVGQRLRTATNYITKVVTAKIWRSHTIMRYGIT